MTGFPSVLLAIKVELLLNGAWTDVSTYVLSRDAIAITGGRTNRGDKAQPAQAALTFDNRDGRFSPSNTSGAYYPYIGRNTQIRISVTATSSTGNFYSGFRFWGEVPTWPPISDISGNDIYVQVVASGPLRRIRTGGGKGSALTRYYAALTGSQAPIAYWPCEEDPDTTILGAGIDGGTDMSVTSGTPKWKADSSFNGSAPIAHVNGSTWDGLTGSFASSGDDIFLTPGTYSWTASTSSVDARCWGPDGGGASASPLGQHGGSAGGGGEFARESTLAVTPGNTYTVHVGFGGSGGAGAVNPSTSNPGSDGGTTTFAGDSVTVTAHGGKGATNAAGGAGGTGSSNTVHHDGGAGATSNAGDGGAGGGSTGGTSAAGNAGSAESGNTGGAGGAAPTGGFAGGNGGNAPTGSPVTGGGGGGGPYNAASGFGRAGAAGAPGQVELVYTPQSVPTNNVIRFILIVPAKQGGNPGKVILRALTGGTIHQLDVLYVTGGKIQLKGYDSGAALLFTSSNLTIGDGQTVMVSAELAPSGANVAYKLSAIIPGANGVIGSVSGTQSTASLGNVSEVLVAPNGDITKTAIGHISVQYALIPLYKVSQALNGHHTEIGVDRLVRLLNEQALDNAIEFNEGSDHWGFEGSTQSWAATNCALTSSTVTAVTNITSYTLFISWPPEGSHSLLITASGGGTIKATSPIGTAGQPVQAGSGDIVSANLEVYTPSAVTGNLIASLDFFNAAGTFLSSASTTFTGGAAQQQTVSITTGGAGAPSTAAFFAISLASSATLGAGVLIYLDHVRVHTRMGPQTRKEYHKFLEEIEDLDQGILKEAKELHGLKYRTRFRLINQTPAVTLDYSANTLADPPAPVIDDQKTKNDITVHRHKGSKVRITDNSGSMSVQEPPAGAGRYRRHVKVAAERDEQLAALANHLLTLGTTPDERYPTISVNLARSEVAALMSALAGVEIGDYVKMTNLPFWYPNTTAKQLVIGYTETLSQYQWDVVWNCTPESPLEIVSTLQRRW